ncbi:Ser/Thr protein kinase RdoA (MazF antagonist) [Paenibacillus taihuensis]|uniref:Ser/Thr protein kinase RdoA (MazF antagonist) n=1 Tax=Paenibacillus taihuensis TaxID=1156355 RepID=A0A3D9PXX1_9BACL|nr:phosphotransferase [Paenibacillus taihuensis]REE55369.1 Ser/Thr protein kinase RdoA (MazF antagonist) [Paenibacillus taihuensis]
MYTGPTALRSVLYPKYLEYCLGERYDLGKWDECLFWLRGLNDTYRIKTSSGYYILRVYRLSVCEADVAYEVSLLNELEIKLSAVTTTKVSEPITQLDNRSYTVIEAPEGKRAAVIFRYIDGKENVLQVEASCFAFGKSAAELHTAMDRLTIDLPRYEVDTYFLIKQPYERIVNYIGENHQAVPFLRQFADALEERIVAAAKCGLDWGICHGDMHGNNNAFQEGVQWTHYDFEWAAKGWRAYDLAQVKGRKRQLTEKKEVLWNAFISGYRSVRALSEQDESAIDLFMIARRLWVMGLEVTLIPNDFGVLDYSEDWLDGFIQEFRSYNMV